LLFLILVSSDQKEIKSILPTISKHTAAVPLSTHSAIMSVYNTVTAQQDTGNYTNIKIIIFRCTIIKIF
jgi:hypothetical protein